MAGAFRSSISARLFPAALAAAAALLSVSCPSPLSEAAVRHVKDDVAPTIQILSPAEGSYCAKTVAISGVVSDTSTPGGELGQVSSLRYDIPSTTAGGQVSFAADGSFAFSFSTNNFPGSFVVRLTALDWNANTAVTSLTLLIKEGDDIPSFAVTPANAAAHLSWEEVPLAVSYTLYYTTDGTIPSPNFGNELTGVSSPLDLTTLENGARHVFLLKAQGSAGEESWSDVREAIPLSELTLAPWIEERYDALYVSWADIPATGRFNILKSETKNGVYQTIVRDYSGNNFLDRAVIPGRHYFYRIVPSLEGSITSLPGFGTLSPFPPGGKKLIGSLPATGRAEDVELITANGRTYALFTDSTAGLVVYDVTDPHSPSYQGRYGAYYESLAVHGALAFCGHWGGFDVYDVSDPTALTQAGSFSMTARATDFAFVDPYAFVGAADTGTPGDRRLYVLRIDNLPTITAVSSTPLGDSLTYPNELDLVGSWVYVANHGPLVRVDVSNPLSIGAAIEMPGPPYTTYSLRRYGDYLYVGGQNQVDVVDVSDPANPTAAGAVTGLPDGVFDFVFDGDLAYLAGRSGGLQVLDISDRENPVQVDARDVDTGGVSFALKKLASMVYLAEWEDGVRLIDLATPGSLSEAGSCSTGGTARSVLVEGSTALVCNESTGLQVLDVSDPGAPAVSVASASTAFSNARQVQLAGDYAFVATYGSGLAVVDLTRPAAQSRIGYWIGQNSSVHKVILRGARAYLTLLTFGLYVIDVSDPTKPVKLGSFFTPSDPVDLALEGEVAYVADWDTVQIIDVSDPTALVSLNSYPVSYPLIAQGVAVYESHLYVMCTAIPTISILDVTDPRNPQAVAGGLTASANPTAIAVHGDYLYVSCGDAGVEVWELSDPEAPTRIGIYNTSGSARGLDVCGPYAYLADGSGGLKVLGLLP